LVFFLKIQIFPFGALVVVLDLLTMEPIMQPNPQTMVPFWQPVLRVEPLQLLQVIVLLLKVDVALV
jgi:hypothetical protein